jgi:hypothetical protein
MKFNVGTKFVITTPNLERDPYTKHLVWGYVCVILAITIGSLDLKVVVFHENILIIN